MRIRRPVAETINSQFHFWRSNFANSENTVDPHESKIARELWRWQSLDADARVAFCISNAAGQPKLAALLEGWLCRAFHCPNSSQSSRWWCDGVIGLQIEEIDSRSFRILGA